MRDSTTIKGRPLYEQVRDVIADRIRSGEWEPNYPIPNEQTLSLSFGVSLGTIRRAMELLQAERLIARRQGRGTFVADPSSSSGLLKFNNLMDVTGRPIKGDFARLTLRVAEANAHEIARLQLDAGEKVVRETRLRVHKTEFTMYEVRVSAQSRLPELLARPETNETLPVVALKSGVLLGSAIESVEPALLSEQIATKLHTVPKTHALKLDRIIYSREGLPLQWRIGYALSGRLSYVVSYGGSSTTNCLETYFKDRATANQPA